MALLDRLLGNVSALNLTMLIGRVVPIPAPPMLTEALQSIEIQQSDTGQSGFQISFNAQRSVPFALLCSTV